MLAAQRGDALWLTYGKPPECHHALIDAGPSETRETLVPELERRIKALPGPKDRVELFAITHIDADHIQGATSLLSDAARVPFFREVWFNAYEHLRPGLLGALDGERLTPVLEAHPERWNAAFGGGPVVVPADGALPTVRLASGLELTLLSPTAEGLVRLAPSWEQECTRAGIIAGHGAEIPQARRRGQILGWNVDALAAAPYRRDRAEPNGSSIAFIATYDGKSVLCAADAHSEILESSLDRLGRAVHEFTAVKVSHHGSQANIGPGFLQRVRSRNWLISTNGAKFGHPAPEALARIITTQEHPVFHLNYVTEHVEDLIANAGSRYTVKLPRVGRGGTRGEGLVVRLG